MTSTAVRGRSRLRRLRGLVRAYSLAIIAAWLAMSAAFGFYLTELASYGSVFGPLATAVVLIGYLYFSAVIFLGGVQVDALVRVEADRD